MNDLLLLVRHMDVNNLLNLNVTWAHLLDDLRHMHDLLLRHGDWNLDNLLHHLLLNTPLRNYHRHMNLLLNDLLHILLNYLRYLLNQLSNLNLRNLLDDLLHSHRWDLDDLLLPLAHDKLLLPNLRHLPRRLLLRRRPSNVHSLPELFRCCYSGRVLRNGRPSLVSHHVRRKPLLDGVPHDDLAI